jgi:large subunit ribosomal protein L15
MQLNDLLPAIGAKKKRHRVGRGDKTAGKGHKGQTARAGWSRKPGFEGGQMPMKMRIPKFGFISRKSLTRAEIRLHELNKVTADVIDMVALLQANVIKNTITDVKIILSGKLERKVKIRGLLVTKGAKAAIEALGGSVE